MKNYLIVLFFFLKGISFSQETGTFYQTLDKEYAFKLDGETCILYRLSKYNNMVYREWEIYPTPRVKSQLDSLGILFSNGQYAISYDYKYFRVCDLKNGKVKDRRSYVAKKLDDPSKIYEAINHAYWNTIYRETVHETSNNYPLFEEYYYREGYSIWDSLSFKQAVPKEFEVLANEENKRLKDSLSQTNQKLVSLNDFIDKKMNTLTLEELKNNYLSRPLTNYWYSGYQDEMLQAVAEKRPELFLELAEALPDEKYAIFDGAFAISRDVKKALKSLPDSPIKKEYFKYRRRESLKIGLIVTGVVALETAIVGGIITGIVYLIVR